MLKHVAIAFILVGVLFAQTPTTPAPSGSTSPLIIVIGPPLSRSEFVKSIGSTYDIPTISIEDLIKENTAELDRLRGQGISMAEMRYDPAMSRYLKARLEKTDLSHGLALDGYPATLFQAEELVKMLAGVSLKPIAFQLNVPDDVIRERAKKSGEAENTPEIVDQRIKNYHREMDSISHYFPNARVVPVDGNQPEAEVWKAMRTELDGMGLSAVGK